MPRIASIRRRWVLDLLTGKKLTQEEIAALEAKKKEREARCKHRPTVSRSSRRRFSLHSSKPYRCKASRGNGDEGTRQMKKLTLTVLAVGLAALQPFANAQFGSGVVFDPTQAGHAVTQSRTKRRPSPTKLARLSKANKSSPIPSRLQRRPCKPTTSRSSNTTSPPDDPRARMLYARFLSPLLTCYSCSKSRIPMQFDGWLNSANTGRAPHPRTNKLAFRTPTT